MSKPEVQYARPSLTASRFVQFYVQRKECLAAQTVTIPVIARSCALLDFEFGGVLQATSLSTGVSRVASPAVLVGLETRVRHRLSVRGDFEHFQIHFRPTALRHLFGFAASEVTDQDYEACAVLGLTVSDLRQRLGEACTFDQRVHLANDFVAKFSSNAPMHDPIASAAGEILRWQGCCNIDRIAHQTGFSMRNFQRRFSSGFQV